MLKVINLVIFSLSVMHVAIASQYLRSNLSLERRPFSVVWNVPAARCLRLGIDLNVSRYGITTNRHLAGWKGNKISIMYAEFGLYPYVADNGSLINGGIPQAANLKEHLKKIESDIARIMPDARYRGLSVIDWESWRPMWVRNYDKKAIYQKLSRDLVREQHPTWNSSRIEKEASLQFEKSARAFLTDTLRKTRELRPHARWGYYLFPECYNYHGEKRCTSSTRRLNDRLRWLLDDSSALYPSYYLHSTMNGTTRRDFVHGQIQEALRMRTKLSNPYVPIFPYSRFQFEDTLEYYSKQDLKVTIKQASYSGVNGVIIWGDHLNSKNVSACTRLKHFLDFRLGPLVRTTIATAERCSISKCSGHGRCILKRKIKPVKIRSTWRNFLRKNNHNAILFLRYVRRWNSEAVRYLRWHHVTVCQCYREWTGYQCEMPRFLRRMQSKNRSNRNF